MTLTDAVVLLSAAPAVLAAVLAVVAALRSRDTEKAELEALNAGMTGVWEADA